LITIFQSFLEKNDPQNRQKALIVAPTRELALQIEKEAKILGHHLDFKIGCFYGGVGYNTQERLLKEGVDIIVGTPGRLLDFHQKRKLDFSRIHIVVIDEADRLFDMGFLPDIRKILDNISRGSIGQAMLFSATLDAATRGIAREYMKNPVKIEIMPGQVTVDKITQVLYHVGEKEKMHLMLGILQKELPRNALIFTNMKHEADRVARHLEHNGYKCQHISGDLPQNKRLQVIDHFKSGKLPFLVATDVAARGLHIDDLELIINYDLPGDCENYVHRIGRTARAGKSGKAISLACEKYIYNLEAIENFIGMKIPVAYAEDTLYLEDKAKDLNMGKSPMGNMVNPPPDQNHDHVNPQPQLKPLPLPSRLKNKKAKKDPIKKLPTPCPGAKRK
jgi:ATP-dependent RNA helicase RhlB